MGASARKSRTRRVETGQMSSYFGMSIHPLKGTGARNAAGNKRWGEGQDEACPSCKHLDLFRKHVPLSVFPSEHPVRFRIVLDGPGLFVPIQGAAQTVRNVREMHQVAGESAFFN